MPLYEYKALTDKGRSFSATIDADSAQDATLKLIRQQISVFELKEASSKKQPALGKQAILNLTRELARLLKAGLPLYEALSALEEKYQRQKGHRLLLDLADRVRNGHAFSTALAAHKENFDLLYVSMISNAEKTGRLGSALQELADLISRQLQVRKQLLSALLYPAMLLGFCFTVLASLLFYVIPSLKELFDTRNLHPFTRVVFAASDLACQGKFLLLGLFLTLISLGLATLFSSRLKKQISLLAFHLPFIKSILIKAALARFGRACATLLEGGLPLVQALQEAGPVVYHPTLEMVIARAQTRISQGEPLSATFLNQPLIEPLVPRMLAIAERGGELAFMMRQIAEIYEEELEKTLRTFATVAQPALLLALGLIIGFVLLSVLLPLTDVSSFATDGS